MTVIWYYYSVLAFEMTTCWVLSISLLACCHLPIVDIGLTRLGRHCQLAFPLAGFSHLMSLSSFA